jgi:hypothetical protein
MWAPGVTHNVEEYMDGRDMKAGANIQGGIQKQLEEIHQVCKNKILIFCI